MAEFTNYLASKLLNHTFVNTAYTSPTTVHLSLHTATNSDSAAGTEVSTGGYARQATAFTTSTSGSNISNSAIEAFTASGANYGTVVSIGVYDAATTGNQLCYDNDLTDTAVNDGDTISFAVGAIVISLT